MFADKAVIGDAFESGGTSTFAAKMLQSPVRTIDL